MSDSFSAAADTAREWLEHFRESANPQTAEERWDYLDQAAVHVEALLASVEALRAARDENERMGNEWGEESLANLQRARKAEAALTEASDDLEFMDANFAKQTLALEQAQAAADALFETWDMSADVLGPEWNAIAERIEALGVALSGSGQTTDTAAETGTATDGGER